jgi:hypothetical protein
MIPCPHCEREFEKRAGLMRHVTVSHPHEPYTGEGPVNPGGAIEPEVETYAEGLDELAPGQEPYVDPPVSEEGVEKVMDMWHKAFVNAKRQIPIPTPVHLTMSAPTTEQYKQIRAFIRSGRSESEAWMNVVGYEPPPRPPQPVDERPLRLQHMRERLRNDSIDHADARWLLHLAEIGAEAVEWLSQVEQIDAGAAHPQPIIDRWKAAIS